MDGGEGVNQLYAGEGADTFYPHETVGTSYIHDFDPFADKIARYNDSGIGAGEIDGDTHILIFDGTERLYDNQLILVNFKISSLGNDWVA